MIKKTLKYKNFNDVEKETTHYFHMGEPELVTMELDQAGGTLTALIERIKEEDDQGELILLAKKFIEMSYGRKSLDGEVFEKTPELTRIFTQSRAYEVLFMELGTDAEKFGEFINGIMPEEIIKQAEEQIAEQKKLGDAAGQAGGLSTEKVDIPAAPDTWSLPPSAETVPAPPVIGAPPARAPQT